MIDFYCGDGFVFVRVVVMGVVGGVGLRVLWRLVADLMVGEVVVFDIVV